MQIMLMKLTKLMAKIEYLIVNSKRNKIHGVRYIKVKLYNKTGSFLTQLWQALDFNEY